MEQNLLQETLEVLRENGKTAADVKWCGSEKTWFTWDEFASVANVEYDSGYGSQKVAKDLVIVGSNWWLERHEYDGSEWWEFKTTPSQRGKIRSTPRTLANGDMWATLEEMNRPGGKYEWDDPL